MGTKSKTKRGIIPKEAIAVSSCNSYNLLNSSLFLAFALKINPRFNWKTRTQTAIEIKFPPRKWPKDPSSFPLYREVEFPSGGPKVHSLFHLKGKSSFSVHPCLLLQLKVPSAIPIFHHGPSLYFHISGYFDHKLLCRWATEMIPSHGCTGWRRLSLFMDDLKMRYYQ